MMAMDAGGRARGTSASRDVMMRSPSTGTPGSAARLAAGGEEDALGLEVLPLVFALGDLDHAGHDHAGAAEKVIDLVFAEEELHAFRHLVGHVAGPLHDPGKIERDPLGAESEDFRLLHLAVKLGALEQRLRGNAAPVEARAARPLQLDAGDLLAELPGANRRDIAGRPAANHYQIVNRGFRHKRSLERKEAGATVAKPLPGVKRKPGGPGILAGNMQIIVRLPPPGRSLFRGRAVRFQGMTHHKGIVFAGAPP